jgi:uncharacterized membrane protein
VFASSLKRWLSEKYIFLGLLVLALLLRLPLLSGSFWLDEAAQALESTRTLTQQLDIAADFQPPLYHFIVHFLSYVSRDEWWLRLASVIPGIASIALAMSLARRWFGKGAMIVVGAFLATSSLHVYFSQELRSYMLAVSLAMASLWLLEAWSAERFIIAKHWRRVLGLGLVVALGVYSSYVMIFWWPAVFIATLLWQRKSISLVFFSGVLAVLLFAPWAVTGLREQMAVGADLRETLPGWDAVVSLSSAKALPLVFSKFLVGVERVDATVLYGVLMGLPYLSLITLGVASRLQKMKKTEYKKLYWILGLFIFPLILAWIFSWFTPVIAPKRVLYLLPLFALLLGFVVTQYKRWGIVVFMLFMSWNVWSLARYWSDSDLQRENWRAVVQDIEEQLPADSTAIVMSHDAPFSPWRWYASSEYKVVSTGLAPLQSSAQAREVLAPILNIKTVVVFDYLRDLSDPYKVIETALTDAGYQEKAVFDYAQIGFVRVYLQDRLYAGRIL